jgi:hypothetical protein
LFGTFLLFWRSIFLLCLSSAFAGVNKHH